MPKDPIRSLERLEKTVVPRVSRVVNRSNRKVYRKLKMQHLSGSTTATSLARRSRGIPIRFHKAKLVGHIIEAGVSTPVSWARVHMGRRGTATRIPAKKGMLAIPTDFARTGRGRVKAGPRSQIWGPTKIFKGIIWGHYGGWSYMATGKVGKKASSLGMRERRMAGERFKKGQLVPLFILKGSVMVRRRIDPMVDLIKWVKPKFMKDLNKQVLKA
jgi:hypothetical protein